MLAIFNDNRGMAGAHIISGLPANLVVQNWNTAGGVAKRFKAALTGYRMAGMGGYQFLHSLKDVIYVYVFGERMGEVQISGVAFQGLCGLALDSTGLDDIYNFYNENRLSQSGIPISITLGIQTTISAFLIGFEIGTNDPQTGLSPFTLTLRYPPQKSRTLQSSSSANQPEQIPAPAEELPPPSSSPFERILPPEPPQTVFTYTFPAP